MTYVVGIDPGPMVGLVGLFPHSPKTPPDVIQCSAHTLMDVLTGLSYVGGADMVITAEKFIVGLRAARSSTPLAGRMTREVIALCRAWVALRDGVNYIERSAAQVKPWASDVRLVRAGLYKPTAGMRHARDAGRHALFTAVHDYGMPDPLSRVVRGGAR